MVAQFEADIDHLLRKVFAGASTVPPVRIVHRTPIKSPKL